MTAGMPERPTHEPGDETSPAEAGARPIVVRFARGLVTWLFVSALLIGTLELAVRVQDWIRYRTPILSPYRSEEDLVIRDTDGHLHRMLDARLAAEVLDQAHHPLHTPRSERCIDQHHSC